MKWKTDTQYTEARIREVEQVDNGWGLYFDGGLVLGCTNGICQQAPTVGETARLESMNNFRLLRRVAGA